LPICELKNVSDYNSNLKKKKIYTKIEVGLHSITYLLITNSCGYCQSSGKKTMMTLLFYAVNSASTAYLTISIILNIQNVNSSL